MPGEPRTGTPGEIHVTTGKKISVPTSLKEQFRNFLIELFRQYAEVNIKWSQTQLCTNRRPVARYNRRHHQ